MTSIDLRPALLFFSLTGVKTAASISARKLSNGTTRAIISSGSPKLPHRPHTRESCCPNQPPTNSRKSLFFEVPLCHNTPSSLSSAKSDRLLSNSKNGKQAHFRDSQISG